MYPKKVFRKQISLFVFFLKYAVFLKQVPWFIVIGQYKDYGEYSLYKLTPCLYIFICIDCMKRLACLLLGCGVFAITWLNTSVHFRNINIFQTFNLESVSNFYCKLLVSGFFVFFIWGSCLFIFAFLCFFLPLPYIIFSFSLLPSFLFLLRNLAGCRWQCILAVPL